jgi:small neutral amino acid transporter SnatA (MarC family)
MYRWVWLIDVLSAVRRLSGHRPLGNVPLFLSVLKTGAQEQRRIVLLREIALAYLVLVKFLLVGDIFAVPRSRAGAKAPRA